MILDFAQLNKVYFTVSDVFAERQQAIGKKRFEMHEPRPTDALMLFTGSESICYQKGEMPIYIPHGALVYVPKNSRYIWEDSPPFEDNKLEKLLFEFTLNFVDTSRGRTDEVILSVPSGEHISFGKKIMVVSTENTRLYEKGFEKLIHAFHNKNNSLLGLFSVAYDFFDTLSNQCNLKAKSFVDFRTIEKGIRYMEQNPCPEKSIQEISDMCGVCVGHFERLFKKYSGQTPSQYINTNKILSIKKLLQNKNLSLVEIADKMKYCDSGYLCRFFLKKTGMTPTEYRNFYFYSIGQLTENKSNS